MSEIKNATKNRLQFVHHNEVFATRDAAMEYLLDTPNSGRNGIGFRRPALFAEPMVLAYGDPTDPNILLAIGSVGDGKTASSDNKVFFIDMADAKKQIEVLGEKVDSSEATVEEIDSLVEQIIKSCGLNDDGTNIKYEGTIIGSAKTINDAIVELSKNIKDVSKAANFYVEDTDTIKLDLVKTEDSNTLSGSIKLCPHKEFEGLHGLFENQIAKYYDGIFMNVNLKYNDDKLTLVVNGKNVTSCTMPQESHLVSGVYNVEDECLHLTSNLGEDVVISLSSLIEEWVVLNEDDTTTPIVLKRDRVKVLGKDVLSADVRLFESDSVNNILKKSKTNKYLYVDGVAKNINYVDNHGKYGDGVKTVMTVQEALDNAALGVSNVESNIINVKSNGLHAAVDVSYNKSENTLYFKRTNTEGETLVSKYELATMEIANDIMYNSTTNELIIHYTTGGTIKTLKIPLTEVFKEFTVDNSNTTVTLDYNYSDIVGHNVLKANVNIATLSDNILDNVNHTLYVKGTADNIKYGNGTVKDALDKATSGSSNIQQQLDEEIAARTASDAAISAALEEERSAAREAENGLKTKIETEESTRDLADKAISTNLTAEIERAKTEEKKNKDAIEALDSELDEIVEDLENADANLKAYVDSVSGYCTTVETKVNTLETTCETSFNEIDDEIAEIRESIEGIEGKTSDVLASAKTYTDNALNEAKTYSDENLSESKDYSDANLETAKAYSDEKLTDAETYTNSKIAEVKTYSDGKDTALAASIKLAKSTKITDPANTYVLYIGTEEHGKFTLTASTEDKYISRMEVSGNSLVYTYTDGTSGSVSLSKIIGGYEGGEGIVIDNNGVISLKVNSLTKDHLFFADNMLTITGYAETSDVTTLSTDVAALKATTANLNGKVSENETDIEALEAKTNLLDTKIENNIIDFESTNTINFNKTQSTDGSGYILKANVKLSANNNIIKTDDSGLYTNVDLTYSSSTNQLVFTTPNGAKTLTLNSVSVIKKMVYDPVNQQINITYETKDGETDNFSIDASSFFNGIVADNEGNNVFVNITKTSGEPDKIAANLNVSSVVSREDNNLLEVVQTSGKDYLYVSNSSDDIEYENSHDGLNSVISVEHALDVLFGRVAETSAATKTNNEKINALETELTTDIENLEDADAEILAKLAESASTLSAKDDLLDEKIDNLRTELEEEIENFKTEFENSAKTLNDEITALKEENEQQQNHLDDIDDALTSLSGALQDLSDEIHGGASGLTNVWKEIERLSKAVQLYDASATDEGVFDFVEPNEENEGKTGIKLMLGTVDLNLNSDDLF